MAKKDKTKTLVKILAGYKEKDNLELLDVKLNSNEEVIFEIFKKYLPKDKTVNIALLFFQNIRLPEIFKKNGYKNIFCYEPECDFGLNIYLNIENFEEDAKKMQFDVAIMNPPYGKYYLPCIMQTKAVCKKVIALCPTQFCMSIKPNKKYDEAKEELNCEAYETVGNPFEGVGVANHLGVFVFGDEKKVDLFEVPWTKFKNPELAKQIEMKILKYCENSNLDMYTFDDKGFNYYVSSSAIRGHFHHKRFVYDWDWTTLFDEAKRKTFTKPEKEWRYWNFETEEECKNFVASTETDIFMFAIFAVKFNNNNATFDKYLPWFSDYTHPWTDNDIQKELGLTDEEVAYIHEEMKDFGWKVKGK